MPVQFLRLHPSRGGRFKYDVHTYAEQCSRTVHVESRLLLFTKEEFERMVADAKNSNCAEACLCLYYAAMDFNCKCKRPRTGLTLKEWPRLANGKN